MNSTAPSWLQVILIVLAIAVPSAVMVWSVNNMKEALVEKIGRVQDSIDNLKSEVVSLTDRLTHLERMFMVVPKASDHVTTTGNGKSN